MIDIALSLLKTNEQRNELSEFYEENKSKLYEYAFSMLRNITDAEDAVQDTFLKIAKYPNRFFALSYKQKISYAVMIIKNICIDIENDNNKRNLIEIPEDYPDKSQNPEEITFGNISASELKKFVENIPDPQKQAITLKVVCGLTNIEIAETLNISRAAAEKRISDAYKLIKNFLKGDK